MTIQRKAELFDYICLTEQADQSARVPDVQFLHLAKDGTTCWGDTYAEAVERAFAHDKNEGNA